MSVEPMGGRCFGVNEHTTREDVIASGLSPEAADELLAFRARLIAKGGRRRGGMDIVDLTASAISEGVPSDPRVLHGVTWLLIRDGAVLLEQCAKKARVLGVGEWFVPGGKIEGDETPEQALRREIGEEWPWADLYDFTPLPIIEGSAVPPGPKGLFMMRPFVVTVGGVPDEKTPEGTPLRWAPIAEALASPVPQVRMMVAAAVEERRDDEPASDDPNGNFAPLKADAEPSHRAPASQAGILTTDERALAAAYRDLKPDERPRCVHGTTPPSTCEHCSRQATPASEGTPERSSIIVDLPCSKFAHDAVNAMLEAQEADVRSHDSFTRAALDAKWQAVVDYIARLERVATPSTDAGAGAEHLIETLSRWSRQRCTDDRETAIDHYGQRVLSMVIRLIQTTPTLSTKGAEDTERLDWWFTHGLNDSVLEGSVDLWWADEEAEVERVTHGTSVRDALDKAMRGIHDDNCAASTPQSDTDGGAASG